MGHVHLRHINPFPKDLGDILARFKTVIIPEMNMGQLALMIRSEYLVDARSITKVQGKPFKEAELTRAISAELEAN